MASGDDRKQFEQPTFHQWEAAARASLGRLHGTEVERALGNVEGTDGLSIAALYLRPTGEAADLCPQSIPAAMLCRVSTSVPGFLQLSGEVPSETSWQIYSDDPGVVRDPRVQRLVDGRIRGAGPSACVLVTEYSPIARAEVKRLAEESRAHVRLRFSEHSDFAQDEFPDCALVVSSAGLANDGATPLHEIAFILSSTVAVLSRLSAAKRFSSRALARSLRFECGIGTDFFVEIAKFRALRILLEGLLAATFSGAPSPTLDGKMLARNKTSADVHLNLVRATSEVLAAQFGGADEVSLVPFDAQAGSITSDGARLARNIGLLLAHEARTGLVRDPSAGSYYVDALTRELSARAWALFQEIERDGGMRDANVRAKFIEDVEKTNRLKLERLRSEIDILVGVNRYVSAEPPAGSPGPLENLLRGHA